MRFQNEQIFFSPSDLITFLESPFATHMERCLIGDKTKSELLDVPDELLVNLRKKGFEHENEFLSSLILEGKKVTKIENENNALMLSKTIMSMKNGIDVIAQAYLQLDNFGGVADFLIKVPGKSKLGDYHYEVWDTKLSKKMKPYFAIQLCCYAEMLENLQGIKPKNLAIVLGDKKIIRLRTNDYFAYYHALKSSFILFNENWLPNNQPDPADTRTHGRWSEYAKKILENRRHLSLIANITQSQIKRLENAGINTIDDAAKLSPQSIPKLSEDISERLKNQAKIQISSEKKERPDYIILPHENERSLGLSLLPPHSNFDIFFDIEGFPHVEGGLEYLWGSTYFNDRGQRDFKDFWGHNVKEEKKAFTGFVDWAFERWRKDPSMHIYHYGSYEITALRRLMGNYGIREYEVDKLLRNEVFVDLYNIIRHGVLIGEPSYSIKNVEHIYREKRNTEVSSGGESILVYEEWRANPDGLTWKTSKVLKAIREYNIDDCNSTQELTEWLRSEQLSHNIKYTRSLDKEEEKENSEEETETTLLRDKLLTNALSEENELKLCVLKNLAWLLEFHRRENKPTWWRLFDRLGLTELDLYDDMECLVGLVRTSKEPFLHTSRARNKTYEYAFDINQPFKGQSKSFYVLGDEDFKLNTISFDDDKGLICLQSKEVPPDKISLIPDQFVNPAPIPQAIQDVVETNLKNNFKHSAISDFLFRKKPRFISGPKNPILEPNLLPKDFIKSIIQAANDLDNSYLCIQGPPGAGKTFTARNVIGDLMAKGKRVGVSSNSHKAIVNLMDGVADYLIQNDIAGNLIKIGGSEEDPIFDKKNVFFKKDAKAVGNDFNDVSICVGGTAWLFCNSLLTEKEGIKKFDYLFIDEAGQVSVANLVGMSRIAKNIILMGDQMQLGQPSQGSHPDESGQSILDYLLQDKSTIPPDMGIFLPKTYRMHPDLCKVVSNQVYDNRLIAAEVTNKHIIDIPPAIIPRKHGIHFIPVFHEGNTQGSEEEVEIIKDLSEKLINIPYWSENSQHETRKIQWSDMLFVAPYNYQVNLLRNALHSDARIGSVDKFQGQEAPIVIVSMCASNASESPRGIEFLFSKNRLNVAISRAQSLAIVVGSPNLVTTPVNNLKQMELVNFYAEIVKSGS